MTAALGAAAFLLLWVMLGLAYMAGLRALLEARESALLRHLALLTDQLSSLQASLADVTEREWRDSATAMERILETLAGREPLRAKAGAAQELRLLLSKQVQLMVTKPTSLPSRISDQALAAEHALERVERDLEQYDSAAADAAFCRERFPLSLMASAVRLRAQPILFGG